MMSMTHGPQLWTLLFIFDLVSTLKQETWGHHSNRSTCLFKVYLTPWPAKYFYTRNNQIYLRHYPQMHSKVPINQQNVLGNTQKCVTVGKQLYRHYLGFERHTLLKVQYFVVFIKNKIYILIQAQPRALKVSWLLYPVTPS